MVERAELEPEDELVDRGAIKRRAALAVVVSLGLTVAGALYLSTSDLRRMVGHSRTIDLEYVSDTPAEDIRNVDVYISGYVDNWLRTFPAVHPVFDSIAKVHPDPNGRVSLRVPYYDGYKVEVYLPREEWGDPRGILLQVARLYGLGVPQDGRLQATIELAGARTFQYR